MTYFSEREGIRPSQSKDQIDERVWRGIQTLITRRVADGSFGATYPYPCPDGGAIIGCDEHLLSAAIVAEIPELPEYPWVLQINIASYSRIANTSLISDAIPSTPYILDLIEFCWEKIAEPIETSYHNFFGHYHYRYNIEEGQQKFREEINRIFDSNSLAYELGKEGFVARRTSPVLQEELLSVRYNTHDHELNRLLEMARQKFLSRNDAQQRESLESLWDAWERLKTLGHGSGKKEQITSLLDEVAGNELPLFRNVLEIEAAEITKIGNQHRIRHSERTQESLAKSEHIDYLFHRLLSIIHLILKTKKWL